jgi:hypothetical protein
MENTNMTWYHPKYYKELRKRNKSDQAISKESSTEENQRASDPGLKPQAASSKLKETSCPDDKNLDPQAASDKLQAPSHKHQAPSRKRQAP